MPRREIAQDNKGAWARRPALCLRLELINQSLARQSKVYPNLPVQGKGAGSAEPPKDKT